MIRCDACCATAEYLPIASEASYVFVLKYSKYAEHNKGRPVDVMIRIDLSPLQFMDLCVDCARKVLREAVNSAELEIPR